MSAMRTAFSAILGAGVLSLMAAGETLAHTGVESHIHGFAAGVTHPLTGLDHLAVMIAVGLWSASLGGRSIWAVPAAFVALLAAGAGMGAGGIALPAMETVIAASVIIIGLLSALQVRLPVLPAALLVGLFGIAHGFAHGTEMPVAALPLAYGAGFMAMSAALHLAGIWLGRGLAHAGPVWLPRTAGAAIAAFGLALPLLG